jgi:hypothetical protein
MTYFIKDKILNILTEQLNHHGFTIKSVLLALTTMIFPFIFPFLGVTLLVLIDFWTSYKAGKAIGINLFSEGLRKCIKKWTEYLITIVVCLIVDSIIITIFSSILDFYIFTSVATVVMALTELKSISENFAGVSLLKVIKIVTKYFSSKFKNESKELTDLLKEEMDLIKTKENIKAARLIAQLEDQNKGLKK